MKAILVLLAVLALTSALPNLEQMDHYLAEGYELLEHKFGALHLSKATEEGSDHVVVFPKQGFLSEPEHYAYVHSRMLKAQSNPVDLSNAIIECDAGDKPDFFKFAPTFQGWALPNTEISFSAPCFAGNTINTTVVDSNTVQVVHTVSNPSSLTCADAYLISTTQNFHVGLISTQGVHTYTFTGLSAFQLEEIMNDGFGIFRFCDKLINDLPDVLMTLEMFLGGFSTNPWIPVFGSHPPVWMVEENVKFIANATGYQWEKRPVDIEAEIDESLVYSGDFLAITRFDGLDQIIEYGVGSHAGHSTVFLWINETLHVCESQGAWYWPRSGMQCNPYKTWIQWAKNAGFHVTWLPLKQEYRDQFNITSCLEWLNGMLGYPYGYHNFIFGWIDTIANNFPPILPGQLLAPVFSLVEYISAEAAIEVFTAGLNMRLNGGTANWTVAEIAEYIYQRNVTFEDLYSQVEQDDWVYYDGPSLVCSSFVAAVWRAGGLFDGITIQATEFLPKDIYQMDYIDPAPAVPLSCKLIDPVNPYCQIIGEYRMQFPGISTVPAYSNMNEYCQSEPPMYARIPTGC